MNLFCVWAVPLHGDSLRIPGALDPLANERNAHLFGNGDELGVRGGQQLVQCGAVRLQGHVDKQLP